MVSVPLATAGEAPSSRSPELPSARGCQRPGSEEAATSPRVSNFLILYPLPSFAGVLEPSTHSMVFRAVLTPPPSSGIRHIGVSLQARGLATVSGPITSDLTQVPPPHTPIAGHKLLSAFPVSEKFDSRGELGLYLHCPLCLSPPAGFPCTSHLPFVMVLHPGFPLCPLMKSPR